ncbi:DUF4359 domain-containing protein [Oscillatoria sp. CS-180]|uniref:DUF4359 domain-containing protein n=1 Tax=Oscillatoria sp. CS-180 TaxID=3021720 RepID=UPI00232AA25C|nr:DUF4359 domain-containing protein [Oscillatoria sp. CS-180]MDB9528333.1 DUF4359 domain-containing protein [Oscillatoria sp. CS-180]
MKLSVLFSAALLCAAIAGLVITNPGPEAYALYASEQAEQYFSENVCTNLPPGVNDLLGQGCTDAVQTLQPQLEAIVRDRTERLNIGIASFYRTSFGVPQWPMLPEYRADTLGVVNRFITYRLSESTMMRN